MARIAAQQIIIQPTGIVLVALRARSGLIPFEGITSLRMQIGEYAANELRSPTGSGK